MLPIAPPTYMVAWVGNDPTYLDFQSSANPSQLPCHNGWKDRTWTCTSLMREIGATTRRVYHFATYHIYLVRHRGIEPRTPWLMVRVTRIELVLPAIYGLAATVTSYPQVTCSTNWANGAWSWGRDLNPWSCAYQAHALPTKLRQHWSK